MVRIVERLYQVAIAPRAADVLRRTASGGFNEARVNDVRLRVRDAFDLDRVFPAVAEVAEIAQRLCSGAFERVGEPRLARIERAVVGPIGIGEAPADIFGADFVEMAVRPAQS